MPGDPQPLRALKEALPPLLRESHLSCLPDLKAFNEVVDYSYGDPYDDSGAPRMDFRSGLIAYGESGLGKTRAIIERCKRKIIDDDACGYKIWVFFETAPKLQRRLTEASKTGKAGEVMDSILSHDIICLDDISQYRFTPAFAALFLELVDRAYSEEKEMLVTCQVPPNALVLKWIADDPTLEDTATAILRRIRDHCAPVVFSPPQDA